MKLSKAILPMLGNNVAVPKYDPSTVAPGIMHVGMGNFHRAHMGYYLDELFNEYPEERKWGIIGASVRPDTGKKAMFESQDYLQTLVAVDGEGSTARVLGSMVDYVAVTDPEDHTPIIDALMRPEIKIVSLTITEGGYFINPNTGKFDPESPAIKKDAEAMASSGKPDTIFGLIVQSLKQRREEGLNPFSVLSCDNVPHNGDVVREVTVGLAKMVDPELGDWIDKNSAFPNSMVDRIAPATSDRERKIVKDKFDIEDAAPVFCEPFIQWVMEDTFCSAGRPAFEKVGVTFCDDVEPFEQMKLRILNGGHASLCYPSALLGLQYVHNAMEHPTIGPFLDTLEKNELIPAVGTVPGVDLGEYWETIKSRFSNPEMYDTIARNCYDGSNRQPKFIIPPIMANLKAKRSTKGLAIVSALWCKFCQGKTEAGKDVDGQDPIWGVLQETASKAKETPTAWLEMKAIYGDIQSSGFDEKCVQEFVDNFSSSLMMIEKEGVEACLQKYVDETRIEAAAAA